MITIVNYKMGNIRSIVNALEHLGVPCRVSSSPKEILESKKIVLPGVGSFFAAMKNLKSMNIIDSLNQVVLENKIPILGICLGMQLFAESGTENGTVEGLGWIPGHIRRFQFENLSHRIPHTGFNSVQFEPK